MGVDCDEVSLPSFEYALSAYYLIAPAEASSNLARFDGVRYGYRSGSEGEDIWEMYDRTRAEGFGGEVKRRIMLGTYALSAGYYDAYYAQAQKIRTLIVKDYARAWDSFDLLVSPTSPSTAFKLGEKVDDPLTMYLSDICTIPVNLAGIPALSLPCGLSYGLPVGFQLMGPPLSEMKMLNLAYALERELGFEARPPAL
jgi:aspartyl-tRNA(Asn)/glutamyl-tRNA(Gln) amidotransferase subunit A